MADQGAELLELVYAQPHVDDHRLVYADWLQTHGDPRGEFIVLQCRRESGDGDTDDLNRERQLLQTHVRRWLGRLADSLEPASIVFRKGFLFAGTVVPQTPDALFRIHDAPEWATVEKLAGPPEVLRLPALRALWSVGPMAPGVLTGLARRGRSLPKVTEARLRITEWSNPLAQEAADVLVGLQQLELAYPDSYAASWNDFEPATFALLLSAAAPTPLRSLQIRKHVLMSYPRWRDFTRSRPDLHAWSVACRQCANGLRAVRLEPCLGWAFTLHRPALDERWSLLIDWHTMSASADAKTLELAMSRVRRSDFAGVRVRIHSYARAHHRQLLKRLLAGFRPLAIEVVSDRTSEDQPGEDQPS